MKLEQSAYSTNTFRIELKKQCLERSFLLLLFPCERGKTFQVLRVAYNCKKHYRYQQVSIYF